MKLYNKGVDWWGRYWRFRVGKKAGLSINLNYGFYLMFGIDIAYREEGKWISLRLGPLSMTYFFKPDWD